MKSYEIKWKLHSNTTGFKNKIEHAREVIREAYNTGKCCLSWSAGKDSTAMVHLAKSMLPDIPIIIQFDDCDWPETKPYAERVAIAQGWKFYSVEPTFSVWEAASKQKIGWDELCSLGNELTQKSFVELLESKQKELDCNLVMIGIRSDESRTRRICIGKYGELHQLKSGKWHCFPVAKWSALDVFAYLYINNIEIHPCYFYNRFLSPENIRLSWAMPTPDSIRYGDLEHIRFYFPYQFQRLREIGVIA